MFGKVRLFNKGSEQDLVERLPSIGVTTGLPLPPSNVTKCQQQCTIQRYILNIPKPLIESNYIFSSQRKYAAGDIDNKKAKIS